MLMAILLLHRAAMAGDLDKVKILIKSNADVNSQDNIWLYPLLWAARRDTLRLWSCC